MSETEQPIRATPIRHQCVCVLLYPRQQFDDSIGQVVEVEPARSTCTSTVADPDSPFCTSCEEAGHPERIRVHGGIIGP